MARALPAVWGIVNVTPDSFSDGGRYADPEIAARHGLSLLDAGADVLDVGGESTRPGAKEVEPHEEAGRVVPVIERLVGERPGVTVSVDTRKGEVARAALEAGATIVNDVSAGTHDPAMLALVAEHEAQVVLMHMRGTPETMQRDVRYDDAVGEILAWLQERAAEALEHGIPRERILLDPGIGFGKTLDHNLAILRRLEAFVETGFPVLLGASRKSFLGLLTDRDVDERMPGSLACVVRAVQAGVAAVRVHDVKESSDVLRVWSAIRPR